MTESVQTLVVGAGVVGLAIGRALARRGREVIVLERNPHIGMETSSRNSEVIHAGIYYPRGSVKAELCVRGKVLLYEYCAQKGVPHLRCGKVIVATHEAQASRLEALRLRALANGVDDLMLLDGAQLRRMEPDVRGVAGLLSPSSGIVDSHALMLALQGDLESAGGAVATRSKLEAGHCENHGFTVRVNSDGQQTSLHARELINAAGLHGAAVAQLFQALHNQFIPTVRYAKGNYFLLTGRTPFTHLVYPLPEPGGLGVHATLDLAGRTRFGPDVQWVECIDYAVDPARGQAFYEAVRRYWPGLPDGALSPGYAGIRPKIVGPGEPDGDFLLQGPMQHGIAGLVNLFGIESPGLTASLAIAEHVVSLLD